MHSLSRESLNAQETLPSFYGEDTLVLLARDPYWLFAYWELTPEKMFTSCQAAGKEVLDEDCQTLRIKKFGQQGKVISFFDISLPEKSISHYIKVEEADRTYQVELGYLYPEGLFISLLTSNDCHTPPDSISTVIDPHWGYLNFWRQHLFCRSLKSNLSSSELIRRGKRKEKKKEQKIQEEPVVKKGELLHEK